MHFRHFDVFMPLMEFALKMSSINCTEQTANAEIFLRTSYSPNCSLILYAINQRNFTVFSDLHKHIHLATQL